MPISKEWIYNIENNQAIISGFNATIYDYPQVLIIPEVVDGYTVVGIDASAFYYNEVITYVVIPNTVKTIGNSAFLYCPNLTTVELGSGVKVVEGGAFDQDTKLQKVIYHGSEYQKALISIGQGNTNLMNANWQYITSVKSLNVKYKIDGSLKNIVSMYTIIKDAQGQLVRKHITGFTTV